MSQREYFKAIAKLSLRQTLETFGSTFRTLVVAAVIIVLGVLIHWHQSGWPEAKDEVVTLVMTSAAPAFVLFVLVFLWCFSWYGPYTQVRRLTDNIVSGIVLSQPRGYGDNLLTVVEKADVTLVLLRDVTVVNVGDSPDVVAIKLWLPFNNSEVVFSPQPDPPVGLNSGNYSRLRKTFPPKTPLAVAFFSAFRGRLCRKFHPPF